MAMVCHDDCTTNIVCIVFVATIIMITLLHCPLLKLLLILHKTHLIFLPLLLLLPLSCLHLQCCQLVLFLSISGQLLNQQSNKYKYLNACAK